MIAVAVLVVLDFAELLVPVGPDAAASMATTIPACKGRVLAEGATYRFSDPSQGDVVAVHAAETEAARSSPTRTPTTARSSCGSRRNPVTRSSAAPGPCSSNDIKLDDITTPPFKAISVPNEQYFLLGDNRSGAVDSRTFGPVLGNAIFAKVFAVYWPLRDISFRLGQFTGAPPGAIDCT